MSLLSLLGGKGCAHCPQDQPQTGLTHPKIRAIGPEKAPLYILGGDADQQEDREGVPFAGPDGDRLRAALAAQRVRAVRWGLTMRCHGGSHSEPYLQAARGACQHLLQTDLQQCGPKVILAVGARALQALAGPKADLQTWRGLPFPVELGEHRAWGIGLYPEAFLRKWGEGDRRRNPTIPVWESDLRTALKLLGEDRPRAPVRLDQIRCTMDVATGMRLLLQEPVVGMDIETSPGLYPHEPGAQILTVALWSPRAHAVLAVNWPGMPPQKDLFARWLRSYQGQLIAHNAQFELTWLIAQFGPAVVLEGKRWHDSAAGARVAFQRESPQSLDAACRIQLGSWVKDITDVDPLQWRSIPWETFARYNLLDAAACYHLGEALNLYQSTHLDYDRLCETIVANALMEVAPLPLDHALLDTELARMQQEIRGLHEQIAALPEVQAHMRETGRVFDPASPEHVAKLIGESSSSEEVLEQCKHPVGPLVLQLRRIDKIRATYLEGWRSVAGSDGALHPRYSCLRVATGRLNSEHPNIQNVPKRRDRWVRKLIHPGPGYHVLSMDYSQVEVRVLASLSGDPVLIQELWERADLHTRWADRVLELYPPVWDRLLATYGTTDEAKLRKALRDEVKRGITFSLPYGASAQSPGRNLHLPAKISEAISAEYWSRYPVLKRWQLAQRDRYAATGCIEVPSTGRLRAALLSGNEPINNPVQGSASDIVVAAMIRLAKTALERGDPCLMPRINIHDDLTFFVPEARVLEYAESIGAEMVRITFPAIQKVPYVVEAQAGPNWGQQSFVCTIDSTDHGHRRVRGTPAAPALSPAELFGPAWGSLRIDCAGAPGTDPAPRSTARIPLRGALRGGEDHAGAHSS